MKSLTDNNIINMTKSLNDKINQNILSPNHMTKNWIDNIVTNIILAVENKLKQLSKKLPWLPTHANSIREVSLCKLVKTKIATNISRETIQSILKSLEELDTVFINPLTRISMIITKTNLNKK